MTDLVKLAEEKQAAKEHYEALGELNTVGRTPSETVAMDVAYRKAKKRYFAARDAYEAAIYMEIGGDLLDFGPL